mgnify:CR=1 FL=1
MLHLALLLAAPVANPDVVVVRADHLFLGHGEPVENGALIITDGKVTAAGSAIKAPEGAVVIEHEGWITPGLFGAYTLDAIGNHRNHGGCHPGSAAEITLEYGEFHRENCITSYRF